MEESKILILDFQDKYLEECARLGAIAPDPWSRSDLQSNAENPHRFILVALLGGQVAGFACFMEIGGCADLEQIVISPECRRQGIGQALITSAMERLAKKGVKSCLLEVRASNLGAIRLYEKSGFKALAARPGLYSNPSEDGLIMERKPGSK